MKIATCIIVFIYSRSYSKERDTFNKHLENNYQPFNKKIEKVSNKIVQLLAKTMFKNAT